MGSSPAMRNAPSLNASTTCCSTRTQLEREQGKGKEGALVCGSRKEKKEVKIQGWPPKATGDLLSAAAEQRSASQTDSAYLEACSDFRFST